MLPGYIVFLSAFAVSFLLVPVVMSLANSSGAIAVPGRRHIHAHPTPKFGGVAIASGVLLISPFIFPIDNVIGSYLLSSAVMLLLGILDDVRGTDWKVKMVFSIIATAVFIVGSGTWITNLGDLFGTGDVHLGAWGIPFTFIAVFGVVNAINLIDGLNGLACGVSSIAFIAFAVLASISGNSTVFYLSLCSLGATLGLFRYNYPRARIFMGDSGTMFIGFSIAIMSIMLTQGNGKITPMVPVIVLAVPIYDTLRVFFIRVINKRSPFLGDKTHLHHLMMRSGIKQKRVVKIVWVLTAIMSSIAFALYKFDSWVMLLVFCLIIVMMGMFIKNLRIIRSISMRANSRQESAPAIRKLYVEEKNPLVGNEGERF
ncbi:MAG: MraY family glycosyltransferase [Nitrospirota bacterium]